MAASFKPWEYVTDNTVRVSGGATTNPKKLTGTRLGKILGLDSWGTPFQAWCEIMRVAEPPFEGNKYTEAGNVLEPKIIEWCKTNVSPYVYTPEEFYGVSDAKKHTGYDFFDHPVLGGMWDAAILDGELGKGTLLGYTECKTSSRPQDWVDGNPPLKYAVQGLLYAFLDNLEHVFIPVRFMEPHELDGFEKHLSGEWTREQYAAHCDSLECTDDNTFLYELSVADTRVNGKSISELVDEALAWYETHVVGNVSPAFDPKRDKEYLDIMRRNEVKNDGLEALAQRVAALEAKIEVAREKAGLDELEKELKQLKDKQLKPALVELFKPNDEVVATFGWKVKRTYPEYLDKEQMAQDGVLDAYTKSDKPKYTMTREKGN